LAFSRLSHGLLPSLARGGRPVCWVRIFWSLPTLWLPAGVEFLRRALVAVGLRLVQRDQLVLARPDQVGAAHALSASRSIGQPFGSW
jgi:hypothetical protein